MEILYFAKEFIANNIGNLKTDTSVKIEYDIDMIIAKFKGQANLTYEKLSPVFTHLKHKNCFEFKGNLYKDPVENQYYIKVSSDSEFILKLHKDCKADLSILNGERRVVFYANNADNLVLLRYDKTC
jgi:hypothetical protein